MPVSAQKLVEAMLDEVFIPLVGRDYDAEVDAVEKKRAEMDKQQNKEKERREGRELEKELEDEARLKAERQAKAQEDDVVLHGKDRKKARAYFRSSQWADAKKKWPKMREFQVGSVTGEAPPAKKAEPSLQIKGRQEYKPAHYAMPKPWKGWR